MVLLDEPGPAGRLSSHVFLLRASKLLYFAARMWTNIKQMLIPSHKQSSPNWHRRRDDPLAHIVVVGQQFETLLAHAADKHHPVLPRAIQQIAREHRGR